MDADIPLHRSADLAYIGKNGVVPHVDVVSAENGLDAARDVLVTGNGIDGEEPGFGCVRTVTGPVSVVVNAVADPVVDHGEIFDVRH